MLLYLKYSVKLLIRRKLKASSKMNEDASEHTNATEKKENNGQNDGSVEWKKVWPLFCCHTVSAWGFRMWSFALGVYLVALYPESNFRLTAIYGFTNAGCILLFGALIGDWLDKTNRLRVVKITFLILNASLVICSAIIVLLLQLPETIQQAWNGWANVLCNAMIIILADISGMARVAINITIQWDWVVVCANKESSRLSNMNSIMRRIDLTTNILAPLITAQLMTYVSQQVACYFIAGFFIVAFFIEYWLLQKLRNKVPKLAAKKLRNEARQTTEDETTITQSLTYGTIENKQELPQKDEVKSQSKGPSCLRNECKKFKDWGNAWNTYFHHYIAPAGLALALLYMTVMGFDNITIGYGYNQGLTEFLLSILNAAAALTGIIGTFIFPLLRKHIGLDKTGLFSLLGQIACLTLSLASVWAPGSPFNLKATVTDTANTTETTTSFNQSSRETTDGFTQSWEEIKPAPPESVISVVLFFTGVITARIGLWMVDLTITQILQENVNETKIGIVNGVQQSLNMQMDMLKSLLVILLPDPHQFGLLIILSFIFVSSGFVSYCTYFIKRRMTTDTSISDSIK